MEVNMLPLPLLTMPNASLFHGNGDRFAVSHFLSQSNIRDNRNVSHDSNVGSHDLGLDRKRGGAGIGRWKIEIILVKFQPIDEVTQGFRLKARKGWAAEFGISLPVAVDNANEKLLG